MGMNGGEMDGGGIWISGISSEILILLVFIYNLFYIFLH